MDEMTKKISKEMGIYMGLSVSLILSLVGTLMSGHFTVPMFLISYVVSTIISLILGLILPMKKIGDALSAKLKIKGKVGPKILSALVSDIIYTTIIVAVMMVLVCNIQGKQLDKRIEESKKEVATCQAEIAEIVKSGEMQKMAQAQPKLKEAEGKLNGQTKAREELTFAKMYPKNLAISLGIGFFVIFILQSVFLKLIFKKHNIPA